MPDHITVDDGKSEIVDGGKGHYGVQVQEGQKLFNQAFGMEEIKNKTKEVGLDIDEVIANSNVSDNVKIEAQTISNTEQSTLSDISSLQVGNDSDIKGINVNAPDYHDKTAFIRACYLGKVEIIPLFIEYAVEKNIGFAKLAACILLTMKLYAASILVCGSSWT